MLRLLVALASLLAASPALADPVTAIVATLTIGANLGVAAGAISATTAAWITVGATALSYGASYLMRPNTGGRRPAAGPAPTEAVAAPANAQRAITVTEPVPARRFAYGAVRTGGAAFFYDNANPHLYIGCVLSDGRCHTIDAVYFGEEAIPIGVNGAAVAGSKYYARFSREFADGQTNQAASGSLTAAFPSLIDSNFRQRGVARCVVKLDWGADAQDHNVLWGDSIQPTFQIRGVRVYDPRTAGHSVTDETTWAYRDNPALCVAHAMIKAWGVAVSHTAIDWDSVSTAANVCDATLSYQGQTVKIFTLAGVFQGDVDLGSQLQDMLSSFRGRITFANGKYGLVADQARASVWTVTDDDVLELGECQLAGEMRTTFNAVSAVFYDGGDAGRRTTTTPYELSSAVSAEGLRETAITLPFTAASHSAQILAYRELQESRDGRTCTLRLTDAALYLAPSDRISLDLTEAPFLNGEWTVEQIDLAPVGALVTLRGYSSAVYSDPTTYLI